VLHRLAFRDGLAVNDEHVLAAVQLLEDGAANAVHEVNVGNDGVKHWWESYRMVYGARKNDRMN
jgi:hypothetical protein